MRGFWVGCLAALSFCGAAEAAPKIQAEFLAIAKTLQSDRCDAGRLRRITARPDFTELTGAQRSLMWASLAFCDPEKQHEASLKAVAEPEALSIAFSLRFADAISRDETAEALAALEAAVARKDDGTLAWFGDDYVYALGRELKAEPDRFRRLMASLDKADWKPLTPHYGGDWLWARYAGLLATGGDRTHAWRIASRVEDPGELARMTLDKRFDELVALDPRRFDLAAAAERQLVRAYALLAEKPRDGSALSLGAEALRFLGRQQQALDLLDPVLARRDPILNAEGEEHRNWILNDRALVLLELGRYDEAVAGMRAGAGLTESGSQNVSQTINLSGLLNAAGQFEGAVATLAPLDVNAKTAMSPYGAMWVQAERTCAYARLGRADEVAKVVAFTAEHAKDNWNARTKALLCTNDLDALAATYKTRLADDEERLDALLELSRFKPLPKPSAFDTEMAARMEIVRARPDVQAAVAAVGRTRDFPIQSATLIDTY